MPRREINIFGTSFLDLLSGALAAVIILFVIVPKSTPENVDLLEKIKKIEATGADISEVVEKVKNSVPQELYERIEKEMNHLQQKVKDLNSQLAGLVNEVARVTGENSSLKEQIRIRQEEIKQLKEQLAELKEKVEQAKTECRTANTIERTLGVFAKFGILCRWNETDVDVDMGVQRFGVSPEQCWRMYPSKPWGILGEDVRERSADEEERFELFYVPQIYPDEYTVWVNVFDQSVGNVASVSCVLVFHPGKLDEQRQEFSAVTVNKGGSNVSIATFRLENNGFTVVSHREPQWGNGKVIK